MIKNKFELYATESKVVTIDDPIKIKIIHFLQNSERHFNEIVRFTGKAKSTISKHLESLENDKLIVSNKDPTDSRKKIYKIKATLLGRATKSKPALKNKTLQDIYSSSDGPFNFMSLIFRSIRYIFDSLGMKAKPTFYLMGKQIGYEISRKLVSTELNDLLQEIAKFWEKNQLGEVKILQKNPLILNIHNCYECSDMPNIGETLCAFDEGILESIFNNKLNVKSVVKEIECFGTGFDHCKFIVVFK